MDDSQDRDQLRLEDYFSQETTSFVAEGKNESDVEVSLKAVGQALFWGCALLEFYEERIEEYDEFKRADPGYEILQGFKFARNRIAHQFLQLLYITEGAELPTSLPFSFFEIRWKNVNELPLDKLGLQKGQEKIKPFYISHLQGVAVRHTLMEVLEHTKRLRDWQSNTESARNTKSLQT